MGVNLSFHAATLLKRTLSKREADYYLRRGAQFWSSSSLKVGAAKIQALADSWRPC
jgi:hypothetical protein